MERISSSFKGVNRERGKDVDQRDYIYMERRPTLNLIFYLYHTILHIYIYPFLDELVEYYEDISRYIKGLLQVYLPYSLCRNKMQDATIVVYALKEINNGDMSETEARVLNRI